MRLKVKELEIKRDNRGWLAEIFHNQDVGDDKLGLVLITTARPGQVKGKHYHKRKKEWYCVIRGRGLLRVWSKDGKQKQTVEIGEKNMVLVEIPKNYFHSIEALGKKQMYLLACVSEIFNPSDPDTYYD